MRLPQFEYFSPTMGDWDKSNINVLTRSEPPFDPGVGTSDLRGIPCRVRPVAEVVESPRKLVATGVE